MGSVIARAILQLIERQLQISGAVRFGFGEMTRTHIDLDRREDQSRHRQRLVARLAPPLRKFRA